jgi:sugar lactone lactonase YvrE
MKKNVHNNILILTLLFITGCCTDLFAASISDISAIETRENIAISVPFTVTASGDISITLTSSDQTLMPNDYLLYDSDGKNFTIVATPCFNAIGTATISISVADNNGLNSASFELTVTENNDSLYYWTNFHAADVVLGESDISLHFPSGVAIDSMTGKVFVSTNNHRILRFASADAADSYTSEAIFGGTGPTSADTMDTPSGICVDTFGNLWVADYGNHRILRFDNASKKISGSPADSVLGQIDFENNSPGTTQSSLTRPTDVWVDPAGRLWVADSDNHRILRFDHAMDKSNGANADAVLGQPDFVTALSGTSQCKMCRPFAIIGLNQTHLFVSDTDNSRVLCFLNAASKSYTANADKVFGQYDFANSSSHVSPTGMNLPTGLAMDSFGRLYVADSFNNRVLVFDNALNKPDFAAAADYVLGQSDFYSNFIFDKSEKTLHFPFFINFDLQNNYLWVPDYGNHRVLRLALNMKNTPDIGEIRNQTLSEDETVDISFSIADNNTQSLTISYCYSNPTLFTSNSFKFNGDQVALNNTTYSVNATLTPTKLTLNLTPKAEQSGKSSITITVSDPDGMTAKSSFEITVVAMNDVPTISIIENQSMNEDTISYSIPFTVSDLDNDPLNITITSSNLSLFPPGSEHITLCSAPTIGSYTDFLTLTLMPAANHYGSSIITITVKDSSLSASVSFLVNVNPVNDPPVVSDIVNQTILEGSSFTPIILDDFVTDIDNDKTTILWTATGMENLIIKITNRIATIAPSHDNWSGTETIRFIAKDPEGLTSSDIIHFTVIHKPQITNLKNDSNPTKSKTWHWSSNRDGTFRFEINQSPTWQPSGSFQNTQTATKSYTDGKWYVHVQAKDNNGYLSDVVSVYAILDNTQPIITGIENEPIPQKNKTWTWHANENDCLFRYAIDQNQSWVPSGEYNTDTTATKVGYGEWYIHVESIDRAGNVSDVVSGSVQLLKPTIQFNGIFSEGDESISHITLELILSHIASEEVSIAYTTNNDLSPEHATIGKDYLLPLEHRVVIAPGDRKGFLDLTIIDDQIPENNEQCLIRLHTPSHAVLSDEATLYTYTIMDNDSAGISIVESDGGFEVSEDGIQDNFTVVLEKEPADTIQLMMNTDSQIQITPEHIVFTPENWNQMKKVSITAVDDDIYELAPHIGMISFFMENDVPKYKDLVIDPLSVNITDNEQPPTVMFVKKFFDGPELLSPVYLPLILSHRANKDVIVAYKNTDNTASEDKDFQLNSSYQTTINAFELEGSIEINIINDSISESNETISLAIDHSGIASIGNKDTCEYEILNDDYPGISINGISDSINYLEGETISYSILLKSQPESLVTIHISTNDESILDISNKEVNFYPGTWNTPQVVSFTIVDDAIYYDTLTGKIIHEAFIDPVYKDLPQKEIEIAIKDNDPKPSPPLISGNQLTNEEEVTWFIESGGGNGNLFCERNDQIFLCNLGTMRSSFPEGKHIIKVKEEISTGQWTEDAIYEIEKDIGMPCSRVSAPEGIKAENVAFTITYTYEDIYRCQTYLNQECGTGIDHCPSLYDRGSGISEIELWVQMPNSDEFTLIDSDTEATIDGSFHYTASLEGLYRFYTRAIDKASNAEPKPFQPDSNQIAETIYSKNFSGYATLAVGAVTDQEGIDSHTLTADNIYKHLINRHFGIEHDLNDPLDHIKYFNPHRNTHSGVDHFDTDELDQAMSYKLSLQHSIEQWAYNKMCILSGPLYIILINHGARDTFYLSDSSETVSPQELNTWITKLEDNLKQKDVVIEDIVIVVGTCYSGSFISSLSGPGRVVIASSAYDEPSYRGSKEPGRVREGAFFVSNLFNELASGKNLADSFIISVNRTEDLTSKNSINRPPPYFDTAAQHPLLDDDGDGKGSNNIQMTNDGRKSEGIYLGSVIQQDAPLCIIQTQSNPQRILSTDQETVSFQATVNHPDQVEAMWIEIRKPDDRLPEFIHEFRQQELDLEEVYMSYQPDLNQYILNDYPFDALGKYSIYFYVKDMEGIISGYNEMLIYKNKAENNPPDPINLLSPVNLNDPEYQDADITEFTDVILQWDPTRDPDHDQFTYTVYLSLNIAFEGAATIIKEQLIETICLVKLPDSWDDSPIYWKVAAIDDFGAQSESDVWLFHTDNPEDALPIVYVHVYDSRSNRAIPNALVQLVSAENTINMAMNYQGLSIERVQPGDYEISINGDHYHSRQESMTIQNDLSLSFDLNTTIQPGDINRNERQDVGDIIQCLQIISGIDDPSYYYDQGALTGEVLELRDAIFIMQGLSEVTE